MTPAPRRRLDVDLVRRGLVANRRQAQEAVAAGRVLVGGSVAERPSRMVAPGEPVQVLGSGARFVSRAGDKLDAALDRFGIDVSGRVALDAGASTGGFTDCLLQRGAALVLAVDVGHGQLDARLRGSPRVVTLERTNVRHLTLESLWTAAGRPPEPVGVVTADLSFISLRLVAPVLAGPIVRAGGDLVLLVKPQFEAGRAEASRGKGIIREPAVWLEALEDVGSSLESAGAAIIDVMPSPIAGASGNTEFLLHAVAHDDRADGDREALAGRLRAVVAEQQR